MFRLLLLTAAIAVSFFSVASAYQPRYLKIVTFSHEAHQKRLHACTNCHGTNEPGMIEEFSEQWGHRTCMGCHMDRKAGPVECASCHVNLQYERY